MYVCVRVSDREIKPAEINSALENERFINGNKKNNCIWLFVYCDLREIFIVTKADA